MHKETICVHHGTIHDPATRGVISPVYPASSYEYLDRESAPYPRYFNTPNQDAVVKKLCALEHAEDGILFSSGMAAMSTAILAFAKAGDHVVLLDALYGGTHSFATDLFDHWQIEYSFAETDVEAIARAIRPNTSLIVIESPTNPLLAVLDIAKVAKLAVSRGIVTIIDNTFATPVFQTPLTLGIDVVVHSGTKYLGGHSDLCCGAVLASHDNTLKMRAVARHLGGSMNAQTIYLLERSLKTLSLRVKAQAENAMALALYLAGHPEVAQVNYPGLADSPGHAVAASQMSGFGAMLSFELAESLIPDDFLKRLKLISPAVSLGGIESLICAPCTTSHAKMSAEERQRAGISDRLLRLSVGIEHKEDLIDDLRQALA